MTTQIFTVIKNDLTVLYQGTSYEEAYDTWINENGFQILYQDDKNKPFHVLEQSNPHSLVLNPDELLTFATELHESITSGNLNKEGLPNYIDNYFYVANELISSANREHLCAQ